MKFWHKSRNITLVQNVGKMTCNIPKLDLAKINAYIKFGEILPVGSQDIERKQIFGVNQGPLLWYQGSLTVWALYAYFSDSQNVAFELLVWCM